MGNCHDIIGVCLGYFYTGCSAMGFLYSLTYLTRHIGKPSYSEDIYPTLFFAMATFISFIFVMAIEMRQPFLILPWLVFGIFVCSVTMWYTWAAVQYLSMRSPIAVIMMLIVAFLVAVLINSCILFVKICRENKRSREAWNRLNHEAANNNTLI